MTNVAGRIPYLPDRIVGLAAVAHNVSWSWSREARALFRVIDQPLWHLTRHNPIELLRRVDPGRLTQCAEDPEFLRRYDAVMAQAAREGSREGTWFARQYPDLHDRTIAYFCAEFGLHNSVPIYSGGLGVLAGDHCKTASDLGAPLVGVGLLYTRGYFDQRLRLDGWQADADERFDATLTPLDRVLGHNGEPCLTTVPTGGRPVCVGAWRMMVGRVPVYLLDTDLPQNDAADRELCQRLYGGSGELRLRQEWVLGVGGVRVLRALGNSPAVWHANEGHAAFMLLERVRELVAGGTSFEEAVRQVRATSVFTTHTPVPAGARRLRRRPGGSAHGAGAGGDEGTARGAAAPRPCAAPRSQSVPHAGARHQALGPCQRRVAIARRSVARPVGRAVARPRSRAGAHWARDERGPPSDLDVAPHVGAAGALPGCRVDRAHRRAGILAMRPHPRRRRTVGDAQRAQDRHAARDPGNGATALGGTVEDGVPAPGGGGNAARRACPDDRLRAALRDLQAGQPHLPRPRTAAPAARESVAAGADRVRGESPSRRRPRQADAAEGVRVHARAALRGTGGVHRGLRDAPRPPPGAGGGPLAQSAQGTARGVGHERHEGRPERGTPAQHPGRLVA